MLTSKNSLVACLNTSVENQPTHQTGWSLQTLIVLSSLCVWQRRALRTASEKLRNRTSFSATAVQHSPGTRVNRYIGRLIEARQTESETSDLNYFTLFYRSRDKERRVRTHTKQQQGGTVSCVYVLKTDPNIYFPSYMQGSFLFSHTHPIQSNSFSLSPSLPRLVSMMSVRLCVRVCQSVCVWEESTHPLRRGWW